jgi:citrate lyase subunit beta-like protein
MIIQPGLCRRCNPDILKRTLSTTAVPAVRLRRAMLYVPGSNPRMLEKSFASPADSICYDLEDAVAPGKKVEARRMVCELLDVSIEVICVEGS